MADEMAGEMGSRRLVFGIGPVRELLAAARPEVSALWLSRGRAERGDRRGARDPAAELADLARRQGVAIELRDAAELDALAGPGANHQGVVALAGAYRYAELDELAALASQAGARGLLVALDGVTDPHNLGAIARSAHVLGAQGLIIPRDRAAAVNPIVTKASAGAIEHLPTARVTNMARALDELKQAGLWTAALAAGPEARPLWQLDATSPLCLVLGAEGSGIRPLVARSCDFQIEIPMRAGGVGSLNVSVAAGIALYEIARQRQQDR
jgi:23S rRNA (guanosine2251-2'-O)-methyltransferase